MYFETYSDSKSASSREKQIKKFRREKKIALFAESNPKWKDLTEELFQSIGIPRYARDFRKKSIEKNHPSTQPQKVSNQNL